MTDASKEYRFCVNAQNYKYLELVDKLLYFMYSEYRVKYNIPKFKRIGIMDHDRASCLVSLHNFPCYLLQDEWIQRDLKTINLITRTIQYDGLTQFQIWIFLANKQNKKQIVNEIWTCLNC